MRPLIAGLLAVPLLIIGVTSTAYATSSLTNQASDIRSEVVDLTTSYADTFGPRVSASQRQELRAMTTEARREMNRLVRLVRVAERTDTKSHWRRALQQYELSRVRGDERLADASNIISPHMTFVEQISAYADARQVLESLDSLGNELTRRAR